MQKDSELLKDAYKDACEQIREFVIHGLSNKNDFAQLRACISTISAYARLRAVENTENVLRFGIARVMSSNTDELKSEIKKSLPEFTQ